MMLSPALIAASRPADELTSVHAAGVAVHQGVPIGGDHASDEHRQRPGELLEQLRERGAARQFERHLRGSCQQTCDAEQFDLAGDRVLSCISCRTAGAPAVERLLVVRGCVHVEEARAFAVETPDLLLVDPQRSDSIEERHRSQLATRQLILQQRQHAAAIDGMKRLEPTLPVRHDDVAVGTPADEM